MKRFLRGLGIFLTLVGVGVASAFAVIALLLHQDEVRVPDLTGQDLVTTIELLNQRGLQLKIDRREPHAVIPKDAVISQTPAPESAIKKGRPVRVVVSQGPSESLTPGLVGEHFRKADLLIRQAGFMPSAVSRVSSETVPRDVVIAQDPPAGTLLDRGSAVSILVSSGKKPAMLVMPKLVGKKAEVAMKIIDRMGLQHRLSFKAPREKVQAGERTVISQKPAPGYPVAADATVEIVVSK